MPTTHTQNMAHILMESNKVISSKDKKHLKLVQINPLPFKEEVEVAQQHFAHVIIPLNNTDVTHAQQHFAHV